MRDVSVVPQISQILLVIMFSAQTMVTSKNLHSNCDDYVDPPAGSVTLPIHGLIESILRQINVPSRNSNVVVHINNLYCVTGSQEVQINPCKQQIINVARGDQVVNLESTRELTKRSLPPKSASSGSKELAKEPVASRTESIDSSITDQGSHLLSEKHCFQSDQPGIPSTMEQTVKAFPRYQSVQPLEKPKIEERTHPKNRDSFHVEVPELNIFIDGKPLTETVQQRTDNHEQLSSKLFKEEIRELLSLEENTVSKRLLCDHKKDAPCDQDMVTFRGGLGVSYEEFKKIIDDVSERPDFVKLIVPGGVTGPLTGYFQKVDKSLHEHALVHGVCLLDNGLLVPLRAMLRILKLHAWLCEMSLNVTNEGVSKLHSSVKLTQTDSIVDLLRCFVKSNKIHVALPGLRNVPFAQFEQEEEHIPLELQKQAKVEILGFHVPYINFRDKLVALCKENSK